MGCRDAYGTDCTSHIEMNVKNLKAWPNPIEDGFVINIPNTKNTSYKIECMDKDSRSHPLTYTILENNQVDGYTNIVIQVPKLDMGLYTVRIIADNKVYTSKFIKT